VLILCFLQAWVGHPYYDVIDNTTDFDRKLVRMIAVSFVMTFCDQFVLNVTNSFAVRLNVCCTQMQNVIAVILINCH